ncbi:MAG: DNA methyltransferase [Bacillota bacterium]
MCAAKAMKCAGIEKCLDCPDLDSCPKVAGLVEVFRKRTQPGAAIEPGVTVHPRNALNELSGGEWLYFTKTLLSTAYPSEYAHHLRKAHGANKPPQLMKQLIEFFTKGGERVLDPFAGVGGTLIGASVARPPREGLGIEINQRWIEIYQQVLEECPDLIAFPLVAGDCREVLQAYPDNHFHFIATDPPYNTHLDRTMCDGRYDETHSNRRTDYDMRSEDLRDAANQAGYDAYLDFMEEVFRESWRVLVPGRYMAVILRNAYQKGEYIFTHADLAARAKRQGWIPKGEVVWYQAGTRLRPYGYPYAYVPNIAHQFILVLRKPTKK